MEDVTPLVNYVKKYIPLTEEEEAHFISLLRVTKVKKKQDEKGNTIITGQSIVSNTYSLKERFIIKV